MRTIASLSVLIALAGSATAQLGTQLFPPINSPAVATPVGLNSDLAGGFVHSAIGIDEIMIMDVAGVLQAPFNPPVLVPESVNAIGITTNGTSIWVSDATDDDVDQYDMTGAYIGSFDVSAFTTFPEGITWCSLNNRLYLVDGAGGNEVGEYDLAGNLIATYAINGTSPDGIQFDVANGGFWVYDSGSNSVRHYDYCFNEVVGDTFSGVAASEGLAIVGTELYLVQVASRVLNRFDLTGATNVPFVSCATSAPFGVGCQTSTAAEEFADPGVFDLGGVAVTFIPNGAGWAVLQGVASFEAPSVTATPVVLGDETVASVGLPAPGLTHPAGLSTAVGVCSNGYLWLDGDLGR